MSSLVLARGWERAIGAKKFEETNSAFTLATSELCQTDVVLFLKVDTSITTGTSQVLVALLELN